MGGYIRRYVLLAAILLLCIVLVFLGTFIFRRIEDRTHDRNNREAIRAVISELLTCPNATLIELYDDMLRSTNEKVMERNLTSSEDLVIMDSSRIDDELESSFMSYFTDQGYKAFQRWYYNYYFIYGTAMDYNITVDKIEIFRSDTTPTNYFFTAYLSHGPAGGYSEQIKVEGSAQFYEEAGRLSYLKLLDNQLNYTLRNNGTK